MRNFLLTIYASLKKLETINKPKPPTDAVVDSDEAFFLSLHGWKELICHLLYLTTIEKRKQNKNL